MSRLPRSLRRLALSLTVLVGGAVAAKHVMGQSIDSCSAYVCVVGVAQGGVSAGHSGGPACEPAINYFFSLRIFDPLFDPISTSALRMDYVSACPTALPDGLGLIATVADQFGPLF